MTYKPHLTRYVGQIVRSFPTRTCVITEGLGHVNSRYASFESLHQPWKATRHWRADCDTRQSHVKRYARFRPWHSEKSRNLSSSKWAI